MIHALESKKFNLINKTQSNIIEENIIKDYNLKPTIDDNNTVSSYKKKYIFLFFTTSHFCEASFLTFKGFFMVT